MRVGRLAAGTEPGGVTVDVGLRVDATSIPLLALGGPDAQPPARLAVEIRIDRPGGWLVDPAERPGVRVRRADLGVIVEVGDGAGPAQVTAVFHDAAVDAPTTPGVTLADPARATCWARSSPRRRPPAAKAVRPWPMPSSRWAWPPATPRGL